MKQPHNSNSTHQPMRGAQSDDDKSGNKSSDYYIDPSSTLPPNGNSNGVAAKPSDIVYTDLNNLQYIIQKQQKLLLSSLNKDNAITDDQKAAAEVNEKGCGDERAGEEQPGSPEFEWKLKVRSDGSR